MTLLYKHKTMKERLSIAEVITKAESRWQQEAKPAPRTHPNSKQAEMLRMLQRPEGASIRQMCEATGWQAHTVRGALAGTFKKKLGLNISSNKNIDNLRYKLPLPRAHNQRTPRIG